MSPRLATPTGESPLPALSARAFCVCLAVTLAIFVGLNPVWEPLDMDRLDANIGWSYAPIPLLVLAALVLERKLRWASLAMETLKLTLVKFAVTFLAANIVWAVTGPPGRALPTPGWPRDGAPAAGAAAALRAAAEPSAIDPARTGRLVGRLTDAAGRPLAGVPVWIADGLRGLVFEAPGESVVLSDAGRGFGPALSIVQAFQPVALRSLDGALHTAHAADADGKQLFNYPVLPGEPRALVFDRPAGLVTLTCKVHGHDERSARLLVVSHPFAALTGEDGGYAFTGVPAGTLVLVAGSDVESLSRRECELLPGAELRVDVAR
jgi:hypothetical protein